MTKGYTGIKEYNGYKEWWVNGQRHRTDGPAIEFADGSKVWYLNGKRHREDGPAVERADGYKAWFLNGKEYTKEEYYKRLYKKGLISKDDYFLEFV